MGPNRSNNFPVNSREIIVNSAYETKRNDAYADRSSCEAYALPKFMTAANESAIKNVTMPMGIAQGSRKRANPCRRADGALLAGEASPGVCTAAPRMSEMMSAANAAASTFVIVPECRAFARKGPTAVLSVRNMV